MFFRKKRSHVPQLKIFEGIDETIVQEILKNAPREEFKSGEIIMEEGEHPNRKGYIIESGSVMVTVGGKDIASLHEGNIFGEIALLNEEPRTATIVATEDTETIVLSQDMLFQMIENDDNSINKEVMRRMEENLENE